MQSPSSLGSGDPPADLTRPPWPLRLAPSTLLYLGLLLVVTAVFPDNSAFTSDDGALAAQVYALRDGTMVLERHPAVVAEANEGWVNALVTAEGPVPYPWGPSYVILMAVMSGFGAFPFGLQLPSVLGAVLTAAMAWKTAELLRPAAAQLAFWIAAGSPIVVNATALWGHTLAAGLTGVGLVLFLRFCGLHGGPPSAGRTATVHLAAAPLIGAAAGLAKDEAAIWALALGVGGWFVVRSTRARLFSLFYVVGAVSATVVEQHWVDQLVARDVHRSAEASAAVTPWARVLAALTTGQGERIRSSVKSLLQPSDLGDPVSWKVMTVVGLTMLVGLILARLGRSELGHLLLQLAAAGYLIRMVVAPIDRIGGMLLAWPLLLVAAALGTRSTDRRERRVERLVLVVSLVYIALVSVLQHPGGAGLNWGGRYLSAATAGLAAVAAGRLWAHRDRLGRVVGPLLLTPAAAGLFISYQTHLFQARDLLLLEGVEVDAVVSPHGAATRLAWSRLPELWFTADSETVGPLLDQLAEAGVDRVALIRLSDQRIEIGAHGTIDFVDGELMMVDLD